MSKLLPVLGAQRGQDAWPICCFIHLLRRKGKARQRRAAPQRMAVGKTAGVTVAAYHQLYKRVKGLLFWQPPVLPPVRYQLQPNLLAIFIRPVLRADIAKGIFCQ